MGWHESGEGFIMSEILGFRSLLHLFGLLLSWVDPGASAFLNGSKV